MGQGVMLAEELLEHRELLLRGQGAEEQQIGSLLKAEAAFAHEAPHQVLHVDTAVDELAVLGHPLTVLDIVAGDVADLGNAGHNAGAVGVAQAPLDVVLLVVGRVDPVMFLEFPA